MHHLYEFISLKHPDRLCDYLVSCLLDYCISKDEYVDFRVECSLFDYNLTFTGYININYHITYKPLEKIIKKKLKELDLEKYSFEFKIKLNYSENKERLFTGKGIYYGLATDNLPDHLPLLYQNFKLLDNILQRDYKSYYKFIVINDGLKLDFNLTLTNVKEKGPVSVFQDEVKIDYKDTKNAYGSTGRKLSFDYYNGLIPNNGGSPWGKDPYNADLTLNLYARKLAIDFVKNDSDYKYVLCKLIYLNDNKAIVEFYNKDNKMIINPRKIEMTANLIEKLGLNKPIYEKICKKGLVFSII